MSRLDGDRVIPLRPGSIHRRQDLEPLLLHDGAVVAGRSRQGAACRGGTPRRSARIFGADRRGFEVEAGATVEIDQLRDLYLGRGRAPGNQPTTQEGIMKESIRIGDCTIGLTRPTLIVAEIGVNHDGDERRVLDLVHLAEACGADAVKLQVFLRRSFDASLGRLRRLSRNRAVPMPRRSTCSAAMSFPPNRWCAFAMQSAASI